MSFRGLLLVLDVIVDFLNEREQIVDLLGSHEVAADLVVVDVGVENLNQHGEVLWVEVRARLRDFQSFSQLLHHFVAQFPERAIEQV